MWCKPEAAALKSTSSKPGLLERIVVENFRSLRSADIPLHSRLIVLVGENGSGKTAILEAIAAALAPVVASLGGSPRKPLIDFEDFHRLPKLNEDGISEVERFVRFHAWTTEGQSWHIMYSVDDAREMRVKVERDQPAIEDVVRSLSRHDELPLIAYYGVARGARWPAKSGPQRRYSMAGHYHSNDRRVGYTDSLTARAVFDDVEQWFEVYESLELRRQRETGHEIRDPRLETIRRAVAKIIPEADNLRVMGLPPRLHADFQNNSEQQTLPIANLSAGFLSLMTIVMDMARRMAELNPHLDNPLTARGVVLIDEIDLHLHPRWQQTVITALESTFPQIQFILTTHSPQIISTVDAENVRILTWRDGKVEAHPSSSMEGARSGRVLGEVFGVDERPPANVSPFVKTLVRYRQVVNEGGWDGAEAQDLLQELHELSPDDPELRSIAIERRRLSAVQGAAKG